MEEVWLEKARINQYVISIFQEEWMNSFYPDSPCIGGILEVSPQMPPGPLSRWEESYFEPELFLLYIQPRKAFQQKLF